MLKEIGLIGLGVMGKNIALNLSEKGVVIKGFNKSKDKLNEINEEFSDNFEGFTDLDELVKNLSVPRTILLMVPSGEATREVIEKISNSLSSKINPILPDDKKTKFASVLILIFEESSNILMIKKPITMNQHGGEIAFPGGKISDEDGDLLDTAIRETREESGISFKRNLIIGQLKPDTT